MSKWIKVASVVSSLLPKMQIKIVMNIIIWLPSGKRRSVPRLVSMFQDFSYWPMAEKWHKGNSLLLGGNGWIPNLLLAAVGKSQCLVDTLQPFMLGKLCWVWKTSFSGISGEASRWYSGLRTLYVVILFIMDQMISWGMSHVGSLTWLLLSSPSSSASL